MALTALIGPASKLLGKFIKDKDKQMQLAHDLSTMAEKHAQELAKSQIEVNKEQAKHPSLFVSEPPCNNVGLLPRLLWQFFVGPILTWATGIWMPDDTSTARSRRINYISDVTFRIRSYA